MTDPPDVLGPPAPVRRLERAAARVEDPWGLRAGTVRPLSSERDANILLDGRYVLKVSNPAEDPAVVDMENAALSHAARMAADLPLPAVIPAASGGATLPAATGIDDLISQLGPATPGGR